MKGHIFISYSRDDRKWLDRLLPILKQAQTQFGIEHWADNYITVSEDWNDEIRNALDNSIAAILLISGNFLSSKFIKDEEIPNILNKPIPIFPLLIQDCLWRKIAWLAKIQIYPNTPVIPLEQITSDEEQNQLLLNFVSFIVDKLKHAETEATHKPKLQPNAGELSLPDVEYDGPPSDSAVVLSVNIENFALMHSQSQQGALKALWDAIEQLRTSHKFDISPHEDGATLLFPLRRGIHKTVMALTTYWIQSLLTHAVKLRVALHQGLISKMQVGSFPSPVFFGNIIHECRKLSFFSGNGHIIVTDVFLDGWASLDTEFFEKSHSAYPPRGEPAIDIMIKEDTQIGVRFVGNVNGKLPQRIAILNVVDVEIKNVLELVEYTLVECLRKAGLNRARVVASPRVSILSPVVKYGERFLTSSTFRYNHKNENIKPGSTFYSLKPPGAGTCGRAFLSGKVQIAAGFPDYEKHPKEYFRKWKDEWNMESQNVSDFGRKSRSVMSIPLGIGDWPLGVLCIDSLHPLTFNNKKYANLLQDLCDEIKEDTISELSLLWMLRMNH